MITNKDLKPTSIRLPVDLDKKLKERAERNYRSVSKEVIYILKTFLMDENGKRKDT